MTSELLISIIGVAATILGGYWALAWLLIRQIERRLDERFAAHEMAERNYLRQSDERLKLVEQAGRQQERELLQMKADMPMNYVRREDSIRDQTIINAKLDALNARFDLFIQKYTARQ